MNNWLNLTGLIEQYEQARMENPLPDTFYQLSMLYEMKGEKEKADRYYLDYLVRNLGFETVEQAIAALKKSIEQRRDNYLALLYLGQIFGYMNRYEDAVPLIKEGTCWQVQTSAHYRFHSIVGSAAARFMDRIPGLWEKCLQDIAEKLKVSLDITIDYYFYESSVHKVVITGDHQPAHFLLGANEVHMIFNEKYQPLGVHEDCHALLHQIGQPIKLLDEGIALFIQHGPVIHERFAYVRNRAYPLSDLLDDKGFMQKDLFISYPQSGSFAAFLAEQYGIEKLKTACKYKIKRKNCHGKDGASLFIQVFGKPLDILEKEWKLFLDNRFYQTFQGIEGNGPHLSA